MAKHVASIKSLGDSMAVRLQSSDAINYLKQVVLDEKSLKARVDFVEHDGSAAHFRRILRDTEKLLTEAATMICTDLNDKLAGCMRSLAEIAGGGADGGSDWQTGFDVDNGTWEELEEHATNTILKSDPQEIMNRCKLVLEAFMW